MVMERLTKTVNGVLTYIGTGSEFDTGMLPAELSSGQIRAVMNRLAAYEDSGLEPKDIISAVDMAKIACALHELNAYKDIGPIDHLRDLLQADQDGRLVVLPCKVGEYWRDWDGERVRIESVSFSFIRRHLCNTDMVTYRYDDEEDDFAVNWIYFKSHFTREEAEAALKGGAK